MSARSASRSSPDRERLVAQQLEVGAERRDRRAQLVRGVGDEVALRLDRALERVERRVERPRRAAPARRRPRPRAARARAARAARRSISVCRVKRAIGASAVRATRIPSSAASAIPPAAIRTSSSSWLESVLSTSVSGSATISAPRDPTPYTSTRRWADPTCASVVKCPLPLAASAFTAGLGGICVVSPLARQTWPLLRTSWTKPWAPPKPPPRVRSSPSPPSQSLEPSDPSCPVAKPPRLGPFALPGPGSPGGGGPVTTPALIRIGCAMLAQRSVDLALQLRARPRVRRDRHRDHGDRDRDPGREPHPRPQAHSVGSRSA